VNRYVTDTHALFWYRIASSIPEMHDRMIAVAALRYGATCITRDTEIERSGLVKVIW
jgi:predicted nucleic acid-binding protein